MTQRKARERKRLLAVLLTDARNLTAFMLSELAHVSTGRISRMLAELEGLKWITILPRGEEIFAYELTDRGRERAIYLTGLDMI